MEMQINVPMGKSEEASKAFDRECDFLELLQHPNVVQYVSTAKHPKTGGTILVVELMDCNLRSYILSLNEKSLTSECEISLSKDMACGLAYIHSKQIIHCDLCSDNILLKLTRPVPVADFGMSRLYDPSKFSHTLTNLVTVWSIYLSRLLEWTKKNTIIAWMCFPLGRLWCRLFAS